MRRNTLPARLKFKVAFFLIVKCSYCIIEMLVNQISSENGKIEKYILKTTKPLNMYERICITHFKYLFCCVVKLISSLYI